MIMTEYKNLIVNYELHKKLKIRAAQEDKDLKDLVEEILEKDFKEE